MDFKGVYLKRITEEEFRPLFHHWYTDPKEHLTTAKAKIITPLQFPDYETLFQEILEEEQIRTISYFRGAWAHKRRVELRTDTISEISDSVSKNSHKNGGLEIKLRNKPSRSPCPRLGTKMRLINFEGTIVVYDMFIPNYQMELFTWDEKPSTKLACGIWTPNRG